MTSIFDSGQPICLLVTNGGITGSTSKYLTANPGSWRGADAVYLSPTSGAHANQWIPERQSDGVTYALKNCDTSRGTVYLNGWGSRWRETHLSLSPAPPDNYAKWMVEPVSNVFRLKVMSGSLGSQDVYLSGNGAQQLIYQAYLSSNPSAPETYWFVEPVPGGSPSPLPSTITPPSMGQQTYSKLEVDAVVKTQYPVFANDPLTTLETLATVQDNTYTAMDFSKMKTIWQNSTFHTIAQSQQFQQDDYAKCMLAEVSTQGTKAGVAYAYLIGILFCYPAGNALERRALNFTIDPSGKVVLLDPATGNQEYPQNWKPMWGFY